MNPEKRQRLLLLATLAAAGLYVANLVFLDPLTKWWSVRSARIAVLRQQLKEGQKLLGQEAGLHRDWNWILTNSLPAEPILAEQKVLKALDTWSRESGAEILDRIPQWKGGSDRHQTLNCRVEATGTLASLSQLLFRIEQGPMSLKLDSVQLGTRDTAGQQLTLGLQVNGLVLTDNPTP